MSKATCLVLCLSIFGCAGSVREATEAAAPAAVQSSVDELHEKYNRDKIAIILEDEEIRAATTERMSTIVGGAFDSLTEEKRAKRLALATETYASTLAVAFAERWEHEVSPRLSKSMQAMIDESLLRLM